MTIEQEKELMRVPETEPGTVADPRDHHSGGSRHTPGPWRVWVSSAGSFEITAQIAEFPDACICARNKMPDEFAAQGVGNAHLICAAPEMYEALRALDAYWESGNFTRIDALRLKIREAIAKAEGKS